jgi:hypothetical protein
VNQVPTLRVIPPANVLHLQAVLLQASFGLFDVGLEAAVRQEKRLRVIEQNLHLDVCFTYSNILCG